MFKVLKNDLHLAAIIFASLVAIILETLGIISEHDLPAIILLLLAVLAFFLISNSAELGEKQDNAVKILRDLEEKVVDHEVVLVKPPNLFTQTRALASRGLDDVLFFNLCSNMFRSDKVANTFLKPFLLNSEIHRLTFMLKSEEKEVWEKNVTPILTKIENSNKIEPPIYRDIQENIAFIMIRLRTDKEEREAHLAIWGEPFMAVFKPEGAKETQVPRYYFYIKNSSDLIPRLKDIWDKHKFSSHLSH